MRLSIVFLITTSIVLVAMDANAQNRRRRPRNHDSQDQGNQDVNGGFPGGGFPGGGFPGGGYPGGGFPGGGFPGGYPGGGFPGSGFPGGGPGGNFNNNGARLAGLLQQLDSNRNGQLEAGEVRALGQRAFMVEAMIRRAGMEPKYPINIAALQEAIRNNRNGFPGGPPMGNPDSPPGQGGTSAGDDAKATAQTPSLVPGFGVNTPVQPIPGFDGGAKPTVAVATAAAPANPATPSAPAKAEGAPPASPQDQIDARTRSFAESILKQNDKDGSKTLERDKGEWAELRDAEAIDTDHNGVVTLDELTVFYQAKNGIRPKRGPNPKREAPAADPPQNANAAPNPTTATSTGRGKPYRMLPALDRLPDGLPDWFARKDSNGDGQVTMSEYSSEWTAEKAREFSRYDLNGDGIVTPQECLQVEKKK